MPPAQLFQKQLINLKLKITPKTKVLLQHSNKNKNLKSKQMGVVIVGVVNRRNMRPMTHK